MRALALCLTGLLLGCEAQGQTPPPADPAPAAVPSRAPALRQGPPRWGVYQIYWGAERFGRKLDGNLARLGGKPSYAMWFRDLSPRRGFPAAGVAVCRARKLTPMISLELTEWGRRDWNGLAAINRGERDAWFARWAADAKREGGPIIFRFGFEMNGDWFSWGQQPQAFRRAWRRAHAIFRKAGANNVQWQWAPNVLWDKHTAEKALYPYYPGDALVDWVGLDGYNFGDGHSKWHSWSDCAAVFGRSVDAITRYGKPLLISEIGCADDKRKAAWLEDLFVKLAADRRVHGFVYFNYDKRREGEPDWTLHSDAASLATFRRWAKANAKR